MTELSAEARARRRMATIEMSKYAIIAGMSEKWQEGLEKDINSPDKSESAWTDPEEWRKAAVELATYKKTFEQEMTSRQLDPTQEWDKQKGIPGSDVAKIVNGELYDHGIDAASHRIATSYDILERGQGTSARSSPSVSAHKQ